MKNETEGQKQQAREREREGERERGEIERIRLLALISFFFFFFIYRRPITSKPWLSKNAKRVRRFQPLGMQMFSPAEFHTLAVPFNVLSHAVQPSLLLFLVGRANENTLISAKRDTFAHLLLGRCICDGVYFRIDPPDSFSLPRFFHVFTRLTFSHFFFSSIFNFVWSRDKAKRLVRLVSEGIEIFNVQRIGFGAKRLRPAKTRPPRSHRVIKSSMNRRIYRNGAAEFIGEQAAR